MQGFNRETKGTLLVLLSAIGYGTEAIFVKFIYDFGWSPVQTAVWRFLLASCILLPVFVLKLHQHKVSRKQHYAMLVIGGVFNVAVVYLLLKALSLASASLAILCLYIYPVVVSVAGVPLLGERFTRYKAWGLVLALLGVALVAWQPGSWALPRGLVYAFGAALVNACSIIGVKRYLSELPASLTSAGILLWSTAAFLALGSTAIKAVPNNGLLWLLLLGLAFIATVMPFFAIYAGLRLIEATKVGVISCSEPVVTAVLAAMLLGERLTFQQLIGAAFVIGAVLVINRHQEEKAAVEAG